MLDLDPKYLTKLNDIKVSIQHSEELSKFLDEEENELYAPLKEKFEPLIEAVYKEVANADPLQILAIEKELLSPEYEGLFLPRVLGYAVMRGQVNSNVKYVKPQEHFKNILIAICNSANFEVLQARSGKSIEIGFSLSSDIWITNLMNAVSNKKVRLYLEGLRLVKYRDQRVRLTAYTKYKKQFANFNYLTADLPSICSDLTLNGKSLMEFLKYRSKSEYDNSNLKGFITNNIEADLASCPEFLRLLLVIGLYFDLEADQSKSFQSQWEKLSKNDSFQEQVFNEFIALQEEDISISGEAVERLHKILKGGKDGEFLNFLSLMMEVEGKGFINEDAAELIRTYYNNHQGLSLQNEATRTFIFNKFRAFIEKLAPTDFHEYFEFNPVFVNYMKIFSNEKFNQDLKAVLLKYVRTLLRIFTDKRSKDYQDIKKFVQPSFVDMGFMNEKSVKELFKTKRKPKSS